MGRQWARRSAALVLAVILGGAGAATGAPAAGRPAEPAAPCRAADVAAASLTVRRHVGALSVRDFAGALGYTSSGLRNRVDLVQFGQVMTYDYGFLINGAALTFHRCQLLGPAEMVLEVSCEPGGVLDYHLVAERGQWLIETARTLRQERIRRPILT